MSKSISGCVLLADRHHGLSEGIRGLLQYVTLLHNFREYCAGDDTCGDVRFILGCVGIPSATFCGRFAARNALGDADANYEKHFKVHKNLARQHPGKLAGNFSNRTA